MKDARLVGLCGLSGVGKDEVAKAMRACGFSPKDGFADDVKRNCAGEHVGETVGGIYITSWLEIEKLKHLPDIREELQGIGMVFRRRDPDHWVNKLMERLDRIMANDSSEKRVIADVRFPNEVDAIRKRGGKIIRITRPGAGLEGVLGEHVSERALAEDTHFFPDAEIVNDGTLEELAAKVKALFGEATE